MQFISRLLHQNILKLSQDFPVIYINGPRQAGKTTLVQHIVVEQNPDAEFRTFDDFHERNAAQFNPELFLKTKSSPLVIDEVQMVSSIFRPLKLIIDQKRHEALHQQKKLSLQYILTGSANLLALPELANAMVGRMATLTLLPLSANEIFETKSNFLDNIFSENILDLNIEHAEPIEHLIPKATFPILLDLSKSSQQEWFKNYLFKITIDDPQYLYHLEKSSNDAFIITGFSSSSRIISQ